MSDSEYHRAALYLAAVGHYPSDLAGAHRQLCQRSVIAYLTAELGKPLGSILDNAAQNICSDMRLGARQYVLRRAERMQHFQNSAAPRVAYARGQLSIRKGSCAARTELNIRSGIKLAGTVKMLDRRHTLPDRTAALYNKRGIAERSKM